MRQKAAKADFQLRGAGQQTGDGFAHLPALNWKENVMSNENKQALLSLPAIKEEVAKALMANAGNEGKVKGEMRTKYWEKLAPKASFEKTSEYSASLASALVKAGFVHPSNEKALTGLLNILGAGNQSALRQLMEKDEKKVDCPF